MTWYFLYNKFWIFHHIKALGETAVKEQSIQRGVDFSAAKRNPDGRLCFTQEKIVETVTKDPVMKCTTKSVEICPFSYNVQFEPVQEEVGRKTNVIWFELKANNISKLVTFEKSYIISLSYKYRQIIGIIPRNVTL